MLRSRIFSALAHGMTTLAFVAILASAQPSSAAWDGAAVEDVSAKVVDAIIIRPLATMRVIVGAAMLVPASLLSVWGGSEGLNSGYDLLVAEPIEYAFDRKLGDF
jgi:hypothetical protein